MHKCKQDCIYECRHFMQISWDEETIHEETNIIKWNAGFSET